jgi:hypothetical protein
MNNDFNRLLEQSIDILVYDFQNKYQSLKNRGINKDNINNYMDEYQNIRIKDFTNNYKIIKSIYNK